MARRICPACDYRMPAHHMGAPLQQEHARHVHRGQHPHCFDCGTCPGCRARYGEACFCDPEMTEVTG